MNISPETSRLIQNFFRVHLIGRQNVSPNTVASYRDTFRMFLPFAARYEAHGHATGITMDHLGREAVLAFLEQLERDRQNCPSTRNARLAALRAFFRFAAIEDPTAEHVAQQVLSIPWKRTTTRVVAFLDRQEVEEILQTVNRQTPAGRRDAALLHFLYNTGARAQEVIDLNVSRLRLAPPFQVLVMGKGRKERLCPLWPETAQLVKDMLRDRQVNAENDVPLFVNARGHRLTRFGLEHIVRVHVAQAAKTRPSLICKRITPHTFRHTTALHLLQSGVEMNVVRSWLGHASIETTHGYVEIDMQMKREALKACQPVKPTGRHPRWLQPDLLSWLEDL
jgi:site-specific recombinase XerD